tara:strand:+ start:42784 stop:44013 length:1230 start_codon:yes stop_codon:yes gene_type:complete
MKKTLLLLLSLTFLSGCATYQMGVSSARRQMQNGNFVQAAESLKEKAMQPTKDQLVYLLEYATALQMAGKFKESNQALLLAEDIAEIQDYTSISKEAGSLLLNEGMVQYKGDPFEKVMINAMLAINFLMMGDLDASLVETRKLNQMLYLYKKEGKRPYEQNEFAHYLAAMIWEQDRKFDDAYIDYEKAYSLNPNLPYIREDLIRVAWQSRRMEQYKKWKREFSEVKFDPKSTRSKDGELIVIFQQGWGPRKQARPENHRFPMLKPVRNRTQVAQVLVNGKPMTETLMAYDVEHASIKTLDDDYGRLVAKRAAGVVVKAVAADQIRQQNEGLGDLAWLVMNIADQADLRQWSTLPQTIQVARIPLKPGEYTVSLEGLYASEGDSTGEVMPPKTITINPRKATFVSWRSLQ